MTDTLIEAYNAMPNYFTSTQFHKHLRKVGVSESIINNGAFMNFARHVGLTRIAKKTFLKNDHSELKVKALARHATNIEQPKSMSSDISTAIALLKANGYRILQPVNQWEEL